jgi:hypothetical protein
MVEVAMVMMLVGISDDGFRAGKRKLGLLRKPHGDVGGWGKFLS